MKHNNVAKKYGSKLAAATTALTLAPTMALAQTDYSGLADAVDWTDVGTALLAVGAAIIGIMVVFKGIKLVVRAVKSA